MHGFPDTQKNSQVNTDYDLVIIGGGINGAGIARDAAGRGYRVCLVEKSDFGSATSAASTKLIHGGLRYLEHYAFRLVRESLQERAVLLKMAPHIIWPMRFILPHHKGLRPAWLIRLGLWLYDHLGGRQPVPKSEYLHFKSHPAGALIKSDFETGFAYSDCWVEDSRLVVLNLRDAERLGAEVFNGTQLVSASAADDIWHLELSSENGPRSITSKMLVNAAGPWGVDVLQRLKSEQTPTNQPSAKLRLIKGSHLIINRKLPSDAAYLLQNADGRITFLVPYEGEFTLVGTTDVDFHDLPENIDISKDEIAYLMEMVNPYLRSPITSDEIVASYAGVRPLYDDGKGQAAKANRDYHLELDNSYGASLLNVFGGKLTTYRRLAESALSHINQAFGQSAASWTGTVCLPGGDFGSLGQDGLARKLQQQISDMPDRVALRLVRAYGTDCQMFLGQADKMAALGQDFGYGLSEAELRYLIDVEYAKTAEDILYRRSKLYLHLDNTAQQHIADWVKDYIQQGRA
ncbi:MAG: glycerol-3-phosphate dehydrogenase [Candidatus Puniceispirillaceae bacterium]